MRVLAPLLLIGLAGAHTTAEACPRGALCMTAGAAPREIAPPPPAPRPARLRIELRAPADPLPSLRFSADARPSHAADPMPWVWSALRTRVYSQLPTTTSDSVTLTLAPVVVTGQYDTIPGLGVAGAWD